MSRYIKAITTIISIGLFSTILTNCSKEDQENTEKTTESNKPLNISIFVDLSDRLERELTPSQKERDLRIVEHITEYYKNCTLGKNILDSKNKIQIFTYPAPKHDEINDLTDSLSFDIEKLPKSVERRIQTTRLNEKFFNNLNKIYEIAISQQNWVGCDIWDFFSNNKIDKQCINDGYRNIMIILTDGYLYHENNKIKEGNAFSYILPQTLSIPNSSLITKRKGLQDLEILVLEINPYHPTQRDKLINTLSNWFESMEIGRYEINETDLTTITKKSIDQFLQ